MKQILLIVTLLIGTFVYSNAQTTLKRDSVKAANKAAGLNKDGTPDMRLKANKDAAKGKQAIQPAAVPAPTVQTATPPKAAAQAPAAVVPKAATQTQAKPTATSTTDKVFGTDAKGRTIYEGPKGGHYYINSKGNKEYVKKT